MNIFDLLSNPFPHLIYIAIGFYLVSIPQRVRTITNSDNTEVVLKNGGGLIARSSEDLKRKRYLANAIVPFAELKLGDKNIQLATWKAKILLKYSEIDQVTISKFGALEVVSKNSKGGFIFSSLGVGKLLKIMQQKNVKVQILSTSDIIFANLSNLTQLIFWPVSAYIVGYAIVINLLK